MVLFLLRSYLKIGPEGLELLLWPGKPIVASWGEITHLEYKKIAGFLTYDRLFLDRSFYENRSVIVLTQNSRQWVAAQKKFIVLSDFVGWPDGDLAKGLQQFAPQIFEPANPASNNS